MKFEPANIINKTLAYLQGSCESEYISHSYATFTKLVGTFDEASRLATLQAVSPSPSKALDDIRELVTALFDVPMCLVSIIEQDTLRMFCAPNCGEACKERAGSFCETVLESPTPELIVIEDLTKDARFFDNPMVTDGPCFRFYAGAPLVSSTGDRLGSLCISDTKTRKFTLGHYNFLTICAEMVVRILESEKRETLQAIAEKQGRVMMRAMNVFDFPFLLVDSTTWVINVANKGWDSYLGIPGGKDLDLHGTNLWDFFEVASSGLGDLKVSLESAMKSQEPFKASVKVGNRVFSVVFKCASSDMLQDAVPIGKLLVIVSCLFNCFILEN